MKNILVLCGGQSSEHSVSLRSGHSVLTHIDRSKFRVIAVAIDEAGDWFTGEPLVAGLETHGTVKIAEGLSPAKLEKGRFTGGEFLEEPVDCVFSLLHGTYGEDGCMQGLFRMQHLAYVGSDPLASALAMDKDMLKRVLFPAKIPMARWITLYDHAPRPGYDEVAEELGTTVFVKPAAQGSSVGVSMATDEESFERAVAHAFEFDRKVLVEERIRGREVEVAILGNEDLTASVIGEIIPAEEFYTYEAKYVNDSAKLVVGTDLPEEQADLLQTTAMQAYRLLGLEGLARMDFFAAEDGRIWFNEPNTLPGFTSISMYPKLMEASGIPYPELIERLIELGIQRHERTEALKKTPGGN